MKKQVRHPCRDKYWWCSLRRHLEPSLAEAKRFRRFQDAIMTHPERDDGCGFVVDHFRVEGDELVWRHGEESCVQNGERVERIRVPCQLKSNNMTTDYKIRWPLLYMVAPDIKRGDTSNTTRWTRWPMAYSKVFLTYKVTPGIQQGERSDPCHDKVTPEIQQGDHWHKARWPLTYTSMTPYIQQDEQGDQ